MPGQFENKTALVAGGGTGIGRATALALAAEGAVVTVAERQQRPIGVAVRPVGCASEKTVALDGVTASSRGMRGSTSSGRPRGRTPR